MNSDYDETYIHMKKIIVISLFLTGYVYLNAQIMVNSPNQQMVEDAVKSGLVILHQQYQLQDVTATTPSFYGWGGEKHFGESYTLSIKIPEGYYLSDPAAFPWKYDQNFEEYQNNPKYAPVLSKSEFRNLSDSLFSPSVTVSNPWEVSENRIYSVHDTAFTNRGFMVDTTSLGTLNGWIVWVEALKPLLEQTTQPLSCVIYSLELTIENGQLLYEVNAPSTRGTLLGGIYVVPEVTDVGQLTFKLLGILYQENNSWGVVRIQESTNRERPSVEGGLTPINPEPAQPVPTSKRNNRRANKREL